MTDPAPPPLEVLWVTEADVAVALGNPPTRPADVAWLEACTLAANRVAWRRRSAAGYVDDPLEVPDDAVANGCVTYAVARYRSRGSVDGYASFEETTGFAPVGGAWGDILKLWGVPRMAVG